MTDEKPTVSSISIYISLKLVVFRGLEAKIYFSEKTNKLGPYSCKPRLASEKSVVISANNNVPAVKFLISGKDGICVLNKNGCS